MKRALVLFCLGLTLPLAGCLNVKTCSQDSDCGGTGRCDVELRFCVFDPDSGLSATGGGGALGGGSGGGVTGGGGGVTRWKYGDQSGSCVS